MKPVKAIPSITGYSDYRKYLSNLFAWNQNKNRHFTHRYFAKKAGLGSPSALKEVMDGKKNLTLESAQKYAAAFNLNKCEKEYFIELVQFNQAGSEQEKNTHYLALAKIQRQKQEKTLTVKQYEYYSHWYNSAIRELACTQDFKDDPSWISEQLTPAVKPGEVKKAIELLTSIGLLTRQQNGTLKQETPKLEVDPDVSTLSIRNFNRSMIALGAESIERFKPDEREVSGLTLGLSAGCAMEIKVMVREFKKQVLNHAVNDTRPADKVCQLNMQFFPLTKKRSAA